MRHAFLLLLSFSLTLLEGSLVAAQSTNPLPANLLNRNLRPPSPEAAALGRFGEVPVSLYTGVPSISIPLLTLPGRNLTVPIALQYHGGGVRPDQVAPWTGMNWSLLAGGAIVRTCRGLPDAGGYFTPGVSPAPPSIPLGITTWCKNQSDNTDNTNYYDYLKEVLAGTKDSQPDLYSFNFMGYSGQFVFDQQGAVYTIPAQPLLIQAVGGGSSWLITTPDGAVYEFSSIEYSNNTSSTWYLTKVISAEHEQVSFYGSPKNVMLYYL